MNTLDSLLANIDANPTDKLLWGILADFMEEIGDSRSVGMRWLIQNRYYPLGSISSGEWTWFNKDHYGEAHDNLPRGIFVELYNYVSKSFVWKDYNTFSGAMLAATEAYSLFVKESEKCLT